jgi:hypothetical protein
LNIRKHLTQNPEIEAFPKKNRPASEGIDTA